MARKSRLNLRYNVEVHDFIDSARENGIIIKPGIPTNILLFQEESYPHDHDDQPGVEHRMAGKFIRNMSLSRLLNPGLPVLVHMNTTGGEWEDGMAIYDTIKKHPSPVTILDYTKATSMSSIIFLAGDKRVMMPDSHFMYHEGWLGIFNTEKGFASTYEFHKRTSKTRMWEIYVDALKEQGRYSNLSKEKISTILRENMDREQDVHLTPKEAVEWGFVDEIFDGNWDNLTKYTKKQLSRK